MVTLDEYAASGGMTFDTKLLIQGKHSMKI